MGRSSDDLDRLFGPLSGQLDGHVDSREPLAILQFADLGPVQFSVEGQLPATSQPPRGRREDCRGLSSVPAPGRLRAAGALAYVMLTGATVAPPPWESEPESTGIAANRLDMRGWFQFPPK